MPTPADITIRRISPADGPVLRTARLAALEDARTPVFSALRDQEAAYSEDEWQGRADRASDGAQRCVYLAVHRPSGRPVGMAAGYREEPVGSSPHVELAWVWVARHLRGSSIAADLVRAVVDWARTAEVAYVKLWVDVTNDNATMLYRNCGFTDASARRSLWLDEDTVERRMHLALDRDTPPPPDADDPAQSPGAPDRP